MKAMKRGGGRAVLAGLALLGAWDNEFVVEATVGEFHSSLREIPAV